MVYLTFLAGLALVMTHMRHVLDNDRRLVYACVVSVPFVVVRLAYSLALAFKHSGDFSTFAPNVYVKAFMQVLMEFVVAAIVIAAGLVTDRVPRGAVKDVSSDEGEVELRQDKRPAHPKVEQ